jgi:hypothetical protein
LATLTLGLGALTAPAARAGNWIQVSCMNPDGSSAPSEGWTTTASANVTPLSDATTACAPGSPMQAVLSDSAAAPPNSSENLEYVPPAGSTLVGGTVAVTLSADGYSEYGNAVSALEEPGDDPSAGNGFFSCIHGTGCGSASGLVTSSPDWSGTVTLPADRQGDLYVSAICTALANANCSSGENENAYAFAKVSSADLLLSSDATPTAAGFSGSALQGHVHGTGQLVFSAADSGGPGVYTVTVTLDGRVVSSGTPNTNGGACVAVGSGAAGALMFDHQQPCPPTVAVDASVPTAGLPDGPHRLTVTVADAAQNVATVLDQLIRTSNPQTTPRPTRGVKARFVISWDWATRTTLLRSIEARRLPRSARVSVRCLGPHCPRLHVRRASGRHVRGLLHALGGRRFRAGDRILLTVRQPHRRAERIVLLIRRGRIPRARLRR